MTTADTYGIVVPQDWSPIPMDRDGFAAFRSEMLARLREESAWTKTGERRIELLLTQIHNDLVEGQTKLVAIVTHTEQNDDGSLELTAASCVVSRWHSEQLLPSGQPLEADQLLLAMNRERDEVADDDDRVTDLEPPTLIELNARRGVRLKRLHDQKLRGAQRLRYYAQTYLVPHDDGTALCVLQFSTPCVEIVSALDPLFDAVASTLRIFMPDDPTSFAPAQALG